MRRLTIFIFPLLMIVWSISPIKAEIVRKDDALSVANNWIREVIQNTGTWGGYKNAEVKETQEFKHGEKTIGYYCRVIPKGFIIISFRKELAPVKAYSAESDLDPESEKDLAHFLKVKMEGILNQMTREISQQDVVRTGQLETLEIDYRDAWSNLETDFIGRKRDFGSNRSDGNYQEGNVLLSSAWAQGRPFNNRCPAPPSDDDCTADRCVTGCAATAGAQIMRYWNWPPRGQGSDGSVSYTDSYDWPNMLNWYFYDDSNNIVYDESGKECTQEQVNAMSELLYEVGVASGMNYCGGPGCQSWALMYFILPGKTLLNAFKDNFRYQEPIALARQDISADTWFYYIQNEINANRPICYGLLNLFDELGHYLVIDGWRIINGIKQYHMNLGWADSANNPLWSGYSHSNTWYVLDAVPGLDKFWEAMLVGIRPAYSIGASFGGLFELLSSFPYRYFDVDAEGGIAIFNSGHNLQFLPGIKVACNAGYIEYKGSATLNTRLFTRGDRSIGICIKGGSIKMYPGGSIRFYPFDTPRNLRADNDSSISTQLTWKKGRYGDPEEYIIEGKQGETGSWVELNHVSADHTSYDHPYTYPEFIDWFRVRAFGKQGYSDWSNEAKRPY